MEKCHGGGCVVVDVTGGGDGAMSNEHAIAVATSATVAFTTATPLSGLQASEH